MRHLVLIRLPDNTLVTPTSGSADYKSRIVPLVLEEISPEQAVAGLIQFIEFRDNDADHNRPPLFQERLLRVSELFKLSYSIVYSELWWGQVNILGQQATDDPASIPDIDSVTLLDLPDYLASTRPRYCFFFMGGGSERTLNRPLYADEFLDCYYSDQIGLWTDDDRFHHSIVVKDFAYKLKENPLLTVDEMCEILPSYMMAD